MKYLKQIGNITKPTAALLLLALLSTFIAIDQPAAAQTGPEEYRARNLHPTPGDQQITVEFDAPVNTVGINLYIVVWCDSAARTNCDSAIVNKDADLSYVIVSYGGGPLENGETYYVFVRTISSSSNADTAPEAVTPNIGPLTTPAAPLNVMVVPGINSLDISWDASIVTGSNSPTNYKVDWNPGGEDDAGTNTSYTIPNLNAGTTYSVRIRAENSVGGAWSSPVSGVPVSGPQVTSIAVADITNQGADITITLANSDATQETVYYCIIPLPTGSCTGSAIQNRNTSSPHTSLVLTPNNLAADMDFEVRASLDSAMTNNVETARFTTFGPPKNLRFSLTPADGALNLSWSVDLNGGSLLSYQIDWKSGVQFYLNNRREHIFDMNVRSHTIPDLTNGTEYTVRLIVGTTFGSVEAELMRAPAPGPTASEVVFSNVDQTSATATTTVVNLNLGTESVTAHLRYRVQGSTDDDDWSEPMTRTVSRSANTANIAFNLTGLTGNTAYDVQALVTEGAETVDWLQSHQESLMTAPSPPHAPVVVVTHADGSLDVSWMAPTNNGGADITKYVLQWKSGGESYSSAREETADYDANANTVSNTEITYANLEFSYTIPDLSNGTEYSVQVYAVNEGGNGTAAEETATPSTVPGSAPASILASECNSAIHLSWLAPTNTGGNPITSYTIQWRSGEEMFDDMAIPARHHVTKNSDLTYTLESLTNGTQYSIRILATNINGDASREVTDDMMVTTTELIWSDDELVTPREGSCISDVKFGNILADSAPVIADVKDAEDGTDVYMRYRPTNPGEWSETQRKTVNAGETTVTFDARDLQPETEYETEVSTDPGFESRSTTRAFFTTGKAPTGGVTGGGGGSIARILRIEPAIQNVVVSPGDTIRLDVNVYGRQGLLDNDLADRAPADGRPTFTWTSSGGGGFAEYSSNAAWRNSQADDRRVSFTTPVTPGTVEIKTALLASNECQPARNDETSDDQIERCSATINVTVKRRTAVEPLRPAPVNPPGTIPESLSDSDGTAYAVFTPEDGGNFIGEGVFVLGGCRRGRQQRVHRHQHRTKPATPRNDGMTCTTATPLAGASLRHQSQSTPHRGASLRLRAARSRYRVPSSAGRTQREHHRHRDRRD